LSFVGTNLQAVVEALFYIHLPHASVVTLVLPFAMALSMLPNLKTLAPVMAVGTALLVTGLLLLVALMCLEWDHRPTEPIPVNWSKAPLALCAILYSFEGICLILPVESAMAKPQKFKCIFTNAMVVSATVFCLTAGLSVAAFGPVTSGSITAFLLEHEQQYKGLLLAANAAVSLSVLVTFPLQLFPCLELIHVGAKNHGEGFVSVEGDFVAADEILVEEALPNNSTHNNLQLEQSQQQDGIMIDSDDNGTGLEESWKTRVFLVLLTYVIAVAVPNVEALISLAGALSGSATALLIPPILQVEYCRRRRDQDDEDVSNIDVYRSYVLLLGGVLFLVIGTAASTTDIISIYTAP
jgi:proton-coupled amino acid transporter